MDCMHGGCVDDAQGLTLPLSLCRPLSRARSRYSPRPGVLFQAQVLCDPLYRGGLDVNPKGSMAFLQNKFRCPPILGA